MEKSKGLEKSFDVTFVAKLAQREKQIQQNYRPVIGVHKWFARRPGTVFRSLLLAEFNGSEPLRDSYWHSHSLDGVIADPFMGGGTTVYEANRLGFRVVATDINPMSYWVVRQSIAALDHKKFNAEAERVMSDLEAEIGDYYYTECAECSKNVPVKYFIWVKTQKCPACGTSNELFPGYLLAEAERHPKYVVACASCHHLNEYDWQPTQDKPGRCGNCRKKVSVEGVAGRGKVTCRACSESFPYPSHNPTEPPQHRLWALEYHCEVCRSQRPGRMFKEPDARDLDRFAAASKRLGKLRRELPLPDDDIPDGDETRRLHRWGYRKFADMFNDRQLLGLGLLLRRIINTKEESIRYALLTVFSDFLRYQNMLCRYDTYALKCQDIFSIHGFPVGLIQCENNLLGMPKVGSGAFRHFIEKYSRAKEYCRQPFETMEQHGKKRLVPILGESIEANLVDRIPTKAREAWIAAGSAADMKIPDGSLDGVFTDPPYYDNVQYAELMDFCYSWLRVGLGKEIAAFAASTTKTHAELTGNDTMKRGLQNFTEGLSKVFCRFAKALKPDAPFVFTYHHNDPEAYIPIVVAILDAGLCCTKTLPAPGEMAASMHIARSNSSVLDSIFVCRTGAAYVRGQSVEKAIARDADELAAAGLTLRPGDLKCLMAGHVARAAINALRRSWDSRLALAARIEMARQAIDDARPAIDAEEKFIAMNTRKSTPRTNRDAAPV